MQQGVNEVSGSPTLEQLKAFSIFQKVTDKELSSIKDDFTLESYPANVTVIEEGEKSSNLYLVVSGMLNILKWDENNSAQVSLGKLNQGDIFGEMSFLDQSERSSTIKTLKPSQLIKISPDKMSGNKDLFLKIIQDISLVMIKHLKTTNQNLVESIQSNKKNEEILKLSLFGFIYQYLMVFIVFLVFSLFFKDASKEAPWVAATFFSLCLIFKNRVHFLRFFFRINVKLLLYLPVYMLSIIGLVLIFNFILNHYIILNPDAQWRIPMQLMPLMQWFPLAAYACSQEYIGRGVFQELLRLIFDDTKGYKSIFLSAFLLFICCVPFGYVQAFGIFLISLPMGIIYHRYKSLYLVFAIHTFLLISNLVNI